MKSMSVHAVMAWALSSLALLMWCKSPASIVIKPMILFKALWAFSRLAFTLRSPVSISIGMSFVKLMLSWD
eukprot:2500985-Lingulodinium_polyedra.AAC.1